MVPRNANQPTIRGGLRIGSFVWAGNTHDLGKVVVLAARQARVSFMHSITETDERTYALDALRPAILPDQTRVYVHDEHADRWYMGRITGRYTEGDQIWYDVRFPNNHEIQCPEADLHARCQHPKVDPTEVLACGGMETQYFHDRRQAALGALVRMRAASRGLTGLTSSSIQLVPHQVEVIRRVLEDPVQRYMLADEVGLGKTIEAGAIIRQCLLDNPDERVAVLVPPPLLDQWLQEMQDKFHLHDFGRRVAVRPFDDLPLVAQKGCDLLVVDEAHLLVGQGGVSSPAFSRLAQLAHSARRLLLLSATPVLGDEEATLALLHLLDPVVYRLEHRQAIRHRIERRQEYGRRLLALSPELPSPVLKHVVAQVLETFPSDETVRSLGHQLQQPGADAQRLVPALKRHISETYRLHQRLLRTRRRDLEGGELAPRKSSLVVDPELDGRVMSAWQQLDNWWYLSRQAILARSERDVPATRTLEAQLASRYAALFEGLGRGIEELAAEVKRQRALLATEPSMTFAGEPEALAALQALASTEPEPEDLVDLSTFSGYPARVQSELTPRLALATGVITLAVRTVKVRREPAKIVAFSSSTTFARDLCKVLAEINGWNVVFSIVEGMEPEEVKEAVARFRTSSRAAVLICDRSGELGLNLHFAHGIVHLDLPLAPARMEQRIGRVDRFGRQHEVIHQRVLIPTDDDGSPWLAWCDLLRNGLRVFDQSISEVHFILDQIEHDATLALYRNGAAALDEFAERVEQDVQRERRRLDEQYALDRLALEEQSARVLHATLKRADEDEDRLAELDRWLAGVLQLDYRREWDRKGLFSYQWRESTLIPEWPWRLVFRRGLDRPLTYSRAIAVEQTDVTLMRPGHPLVDQVEQFMLWDDRGAAFATWRVDPAWPAGRRGEWLGFRLCYVVEADMAKMVDALPDQLDAQAQLSVRRRADALLPPWLETLHIDIGLQEVEDAALSAILQRPYRQDVAEGHRDYNLGSRQEWLHSLVDPQTFAELCRKVRARSEHIVRASQRFQERTAAAAQRARADLADRNQRLGARHEAMRRETGKGDASIELETAINDAILIGVTAPRVRLDSIGFFVVADYAPDGDTSDE